MRSNLILLSIGRNNAGIFKMGKLKGVIFDSFAANDNKYQIQIGKYSCDQKLAVKSDTSIEIKESDEFLVYKEFSAPAEEPHIATWDYLTKKEVQSLVEIEKRSHIRKFIESKLTQKPKGFAGIIFRELMYTVTKFCKRSNFNLEQTGAVLSQFYLTHVFFTSSLDIGFEKLYKYFSDLQMCHSLPFPPKSIKLFSLQETKDIMTYFSKLYLRNLPIIRFMSLPNLHLQANYHIEPEKFLGKKKGAKGKKGKKKKK